ncbi:MAG: hypothetical protein GY842_21620 [bacterium]|nr:hypothetical protein [bacterium]
MTQTANHTPATETLPEELIRSIESWERPVIIAHVPPDADALGAMFAVARGFGSTGATASVALPEASLSQRLAFLHEWAEPRIAGVEEFAQADGFVVVDTAKKPRCNLPGGLPEEWNAGRRIVNIDHHASNTRFGDINWVVGDASSSCELVFHLLEVWARPVDELSASLLYAGIHTDTAGFSLPNTSGSALAAAAQLVERGARVTELGERLCRSQRLSEFRLLRIIYANTRLTPDERIAYSTADYREITDAGCAAADIDDQVSIPRSLLGTRLALLLTEGVRGKTRINFRGDAGVSVLALAKSFGGGGHDAAAGAILEGPIPEVLAQVLPQAERYLDDLG